MRLFFRKSKFTSKIANFYYVNLSFINFTWGEVQRINEHQIRYGSSC